MKLTTLIVALALPLAGMSFAPTTSHASVFGECGPSVDIDLTSDVDNYHFGESRSDDVQVRIGLSWDTGHKSKCDQEATEANLKRQELLYDIQKTAKETAAARKAKADARKAEAAAETEELDYLFNMVKLCNSVENTGAHAVISKCVAEGFLTIDQ